MSKPINIALASFGMSGKIFHAPFLDRKPQFHLKSIVERHKNDSEQKYPDAKIVRSFDELLLDEELEVIVINTPSYLHYEMAKQALISGKHVVLEKPMAAYSQECQELIDLAQEKNRVLAVYQNRRLEGEYKTLRKLINEGSLGKLVSGHIAIHRYKPEIGVKKWKEDDYPAAGVLYDLGAHLIDQALLIGGWPNDIEADLQKQREGSKVVDYFLIKFIYDDFEIEVTSDVFTQENKPSIVFEGTEAIFTKYGKDPQEPQLALNPIPWDQLGQDDPDNYGELTNIATGEKEIIPTEQGDYGAFYDNLYDVLRNDAQLMVDPKESMNVIKIIEWAERISK